MVATKQVVPRGVPRNKSPRSPSPTKQQIQAASRALAKKKQTEVAMEKKTQQKSRDERHNELQKKRDSNSPTKVRPRGIRGGGNKKKKNQLPKKNLLENFDAAGVARGSAGADEDRDPSESASGSEDGDEEFTPAKENLKNDADYNSDTNKEEGDDVNATEGADEADQQEKEPPTTPPILKNRQRR
jgi:hypothetical protein